MCDSVAQLMVPLPRYAGGISVKITVFQGWGCLDKKSEDFQGCHREGVLSDGAPCPWAKGTPLLSLSVIFIDSSCYKDEKGVYGR